MFFEATQEGILREQFFTASEKFTSITYPIKSQPVTVSNRRYDRCLSDRFLSLLTYEVLQSDLIR